MAKCRENEKDATPTNFAWCVEKQVTCGVIHHVSKKKETKNKKKEYQKNVGVFKKIVKSVNKKNLILIAS